MNAPTIPVVAQRAHGDHRTPGDDGTNSHDAHQYRVSKELLRALWVESRRIHGLTVEEAA